MSKSTKAARTPRHRPADSLAHIALWSGALVVLVALVYGPTLDNGYVWDDGHHVLDNRTLDTPGGLYDIWFTWGAIPQYYPLVHTTFWIEHQMWGNNPRGYHLVNALLHAAGAVLLWRLLVRLDVPGAWLVAAIFAVHPINVESVAWISERKNVLSLPLALASMLVYLRFSPPRAENQAGPAARGPGWLYFVSLGLFVAALTAKTVTASVPAVLLVLYWWKQGRLTSRDIGPLLPFFALGVALASITVWQERVHVGATGPEWQLSLVERLLVAGRAPWFYAGKLFWPYPLIFFYPRWTLDPQAAWQYLFPTAVVLLLAVLFAARRRIGRGPLAAALIFGGVLVPALGFFNLYPFRYSFVADHFQYHAGIALIALAVATCAYAARNLIRDLPWAAGMLAASLLALLGVMAHNRTYVFRDVRTLWEDTLAHNPQSWAAEVNLGDYWSEQHQPEKALACYRRAAKFVPPPAAWLTYLNTGNVLQDLQRPAEALAEYRRALESAPPESHWVVYLNLGSAQQDLRDNVAAWDSYRHAIELNPDALNATMQLNVAVCLLQLEKFSEATDHFRRALDLGSQPEWLVHFHLAECLEKAGQWSAALDEYRVAGQMQPNLPLVANRIGRVYLQAGNLDEAARQLSRHLESRQTNIVRAETLDLLGRVRLAQNDKQRALAHFREAVQLAPDNADYALDLAVALSQLGDLAGAETQLRRCLSLAPQRADAHHQLGLLLLQRGDKPAATAEFETVLKLDPGHADAAKQLEQLKAPEPGS